MKKSISFILLICMLISSFSCYASTGSGGPVDDWSRTGKTVTVSGTGENVSIFLLNPGKTVSDLNSADTLAKFNETVNYTNVLNIGKSAEYSQTFTINTDGTDATYLLYVKDKNGEFSAEVNYEGQQVMRFYVSFDADSGGDGTEQKPFASIEEARDHIRTITNKTEPIEVIVSGGTYKPSDYIEFTSQDSGTADCPITYKAAEGEEVIISGSTKIDISDVTKVTDGNILGRVSSETARHLVEVDLEAAGVPERLADFTAGHVPGRNGKTTGIYLNGERQSISRWPNTGYSSISSVNKKLKDNADELTDDDKYIENTLKIKNSDSRLSAWANAENMFLEGYFANDWYQQWAKITEVDPEDFFVTLAYTPTHGLVNSSSDSPRRAAVVNLIEEIDIPGEWYIDANAMKLYWYLPHTLTENDTLEICTLDKNFITVSKNTSYINFEGFTFEKNADTPITSEGEDSIGGGNGIFIRQSNNISVKNCTFRNIGMDAVYILASDNISVESCNIYDIGLRGIFVKQSGDINTLEGSGITISNCYISDVARDSGRNSCAGIYIDANCVGVTVENNTLCNMKNSAIRYGGNLHTINNNEIYNCVTDTADAGAIYAGRSFTQYGTVINNNYFHTIGTGLASEGAGAVFWDDKHSGNSFVGNIVDIGGIKNAAGIRIGGGRDNLIEGNIFVGGDAVRGADRAFSSFDSFYAGSEFKTFLNATNLKNDTNASALDITDDNWLEAYKTKFPEIMKNFNELVNTEEPKYTRVQTIKDNVMTVEFNLGENGTNMLADSDISNYETVSDMTAFVDAEGGDYRLTSEYAESINASDKLLTEDYDVAIGLDRDFAPSLSERSFGLVYPFNNSSVYGDSVTLKWNKCYFANSYIYEVSNKDDFSNIIASGETYANTVDITGLIKNTKYYWRVRGVNNSRYLDYTVECSDVYSFTLSEGVYLNSLSFDEEANTISMDVVNDSGDDRTVCFVVALKDSLGNLVDARVLDNQSITQSPCTVNTSFDQDGNIIELYIFDSQAKLSPITIKYRFEI